MKRLIVTFICIIFLVTVSIGCGSGKHIDGKYCDTYGLINKEEKCEEVRYKTIIGNVIWGIILLETVVAPVYFFGFSLYEPVSKQEK